MSTYAVGDIHGNLQALDSLLGKLRCELTPEDTLVFLGDYIDRGPDTRACVDCIIELKASAPCRVVTLIGNHEQWLLQTMRDYESHSWMFATEALATIYSYSPRAAEKILTAFEQAGSRLYTVRIAMPYDLFYEAMPASHVAFFANLELFWQSPDGIFVHGGVDGRTPDLDDQPPAVLVWGPAGFPEAYDGAATVVYGHRNNAELDEADWPRPCILPNNTIGIDTILHGVLTAIRLPDRRIFQSERFPARD